jgi:hypothetical protein
MICTGLELTEAAGEIKELEGQLVALRADKKEKS